MFDKKQLQTIIKNKIQSIPSRVLLTPCAGFGDEITKFRIPGQARLSWVNKQNQRWNYYLALKTQMGRTFFLSISFFERNLQKDRIGIIPLHWLDSKLFRIEVHLFDPLQSNEKKQSLKVQSIGFSNRGFSSTQSSLNLSARGVHVRESNDGTTKLYAEVGSGCVDLEIKTIGESFYPGQEGFLDLEGLDLKSNETYPPSFISFTQLRHVSGEVLLFGKSYEVTGFGFLEIEKSTDTRASGKLGKFYPGLYPKLYNEPYHKVWLSMPELGGDLLAYWTYTPKFLLAGIWIDKNSQFDLINQNNLKIGHNQIHFDKLSQPIELKHLSRPPKRFYFKEGGTSHPLQIYVLKTEGDSYINRQLLPESFGFYK